MPSNGSFHHECSTIPAQPGWCKIEIWTDEDGELWFTQPLSIIAWQIFTHYRAVTGDIDIDRTTYAKPIVPFGLNDDDVNGCIIQQPDGRYIIDGGDHVDPDAFFNGLDDACEYLRKKHRERQERLAAARARREDKSR